MEGTERLVRGTLQGQDHEGLVTDCVPWEEGVGGNSRAHSPGHRLPGMLTRGRLEQRVEVEGLAQETVS